MSTVRDAMLGINAYPIPERAIVAIAAKRSLDLTEGLSTTTMVSSQFRLAVADLYMWLAMAPNVSQGGQSYSFTAEERALFRTKARGIYAECGDAGESAASVSYGYKGENI